MVFSKTDLRHSSLLSVFCLICISMTYSPISTFIIHHQHNDNVNSINCQENLEKMPILAYRAPKAVTLPLQQETRTSTTTPTNIKHSRIF